MPIVNNSRPKDGSSKIEGFAEYNRRASGGMDMAAGKGEYAIFSVAGNMGVPKNLHEASERGNLGVFNSYIREGKGVNDKDQYGRTALMCAAENCQIIIVKRLIELGAGILIEQENNGRSALHWACRGGDLEILKALRANIISAAGKERWEEEINRSDKDGHTPITISKASAHGQDAFLFLLESGAKYNSQSITFRGAVKVLAAGAKFMRGVKKRRAEQAAALGLTSSA